MTRPGLFGCASLVGFALLALALGACGSEDGRPGSLVSAGGDTGLGGRAGQAGGSSGAAGQTSDGGAAGDDEQGSAGEQGVPSTPLAVFPSKLLVASNCGATPAAATLLIQNGGAMPLSLVSASADSGYVVTTTLPLSVAPGAGVVLSVTPPKPPSNAALGTMSEGTLSFVTNEPSSPTRTVTLETTLFGANAEFTDSNGVPLASELSLTYLGSSLCPDTVKYRVHNTGNAAFTLLGPTFPAHFGGTSAAAGTSVGPDEYVELSVGGQSSPAGVCTASATLAFTMQGPFCGAVPKLDVSWPANAEASCTCSPAME